MLEVEVKTSPKLRAKGLELSRAARLAEVVSARPDSSELIRDLSERNQRALHGFNVELRSLFKERAYAVEQAARNEFLKAAENYALHQIMLKGPEHAEFIRADLETLVGRDEAIDAALLRYSEREHFLRREVGVE